MDSRKNTLANLALIAASLSALLAVLELTLALFWPHKITARPFSERSFFCRYHPLLGWANKPDYRGVVTVSDTHTFAVTHNSRGLRDREHTYRKNPAKKRIIVLGDSFTWGFGVGDDEVFTQVMESRSPDMEVINMGVSGYGTDQELLYYTEEGMKYDHDFVVLVFFENDIDDISASRRYGYPKPYFIPDSVPLAFSNVPVPTTGNTERILFDNPDTVFGKVKKFLRQHTHSYPFLTGRLNSIPWLRKMFIRTGLSNDDRIFAEEVVHTLEDETSQWRLFGRIIRRFQAAASEHGAGFLVVNIPLKEAPPGNPLGYEGITAGDGIINDHISGILEKFAAEKNVPFVNMLKPVRDGHARGIPYYSRHKLDIHLNANGHRLLAETILQWLEENSWR